MKKLFSGKRLIIRNFFITHFSLFICLSSSAQISKFADSILINDSVISTGHIGISIYEPATNTFLYNYNAAKYFVPASNTKLFTLYAGMKYLGDSLVGIKYYDTDSAIYIEPTGDPTFLHEDFIKQPVFDFLKKQQKKIFITDANWKEEALGKGWPWDDYNESYMAERSPMPIFGNTLKFSLNKYSSRTATPFSITVFPFYFEKKIPTSLQLINELAKAIPNNIIPGNIVLEPDNITLEDAIPFFTIKRNKNDNEFEIHKSQSIFSKQEIPFCADTIKTAVEILKNDYALNNISASDFIIPEFVIPDARKDLKIIHSQPSDSLYKPMMYRSDNFFAEQTLLMVSNEHLGYMNDEDIIDTLLKTDLKDVPQKPTWVDGCGLSRYNLFTPQSFVYILNKMKNEFGLKRLEVILPTGGKGTLKNYYLKDSGYIYAKTGSMNNIFCLSGYLITSKNKLLIFSILANNFMGNTTPVRRAIEQFLEALRTNY